MVFMDMQALGLVRIPKNTKATVSKTKGVLDGTWPNYAAVY